MTTYSNPAAHTDGPRSEYAALDVMERTGARDDHASLLLEAMTAHPGRTACELAEYVPFDVVEVRRRATDLRAAGRAYSGEDRHCGHRECRVATLTWYAAGEARQGALL